MSGRTRSSDAKKRNKQDEEEKDKDEEEEKDEEKESKQTKSKGRGRPAKKKQEEVESEEEEEEEEGEEKEPAPEEHVIGEIDPHFQHSGSAKVAIGDNDRAYDAMLVFKEGKTDKFYLLQVVEDKKKFTCYTRWGRRGTKGRTQTHGPTDEDKAVDEFEKRFHEKTGNDWDQFVQGKFEHKKKKYECVETKS